MDEMDIVRKVTHLFYMFRRDNLLKKDDHPKMKHRDIMVLDAIMKLNDGNLVKMSELSDYFQVTPAAISQIIKQFEKKGWVDRILLDTDRRSVYIQVSEDARRMMKNCEAFMTERLVGKSLRNSVRRMPMRLSAYWKRHWHILRNAKKSLRKENRNDEIR